MAHIMVRVKIPLPDQGCGCVAEDQCVAAGCVISANVNTVPHFLLLLATAGPSPANTAAPPPQFRGEQEEHQAEEPWFLIVSIAADTSWVGLPCLKAACPL